MLNMMMQNEISSFLFQGGGGGFSFALPLVFIFGIFYFLLILPQQRKQKRWQAMINELKTRDKVMTQGGIRGIIIAVKDDAGHLRGPPGNLRLEIGQATG